MEDIIIRLDDDFSKFLADIRENEDKRIENERVRNEFFEQLLKEKKMYYGRYRRFYGTVEDNEDTFELPNEYNAMAMLDVYVNGFYLNPNEYRIEGRNVILAKPLSTIGTKIELVVTRAIGIPTESMDELRGFSAYEVALRNGFDGSIEEWLKSLEGKGGYKRSTRTYVTSLSLEARFAVPNGYKESMDLVDVFVNGFRLSRGEFSIEKVGEDYFVVLERPVDVVGSIVEIDLIQYVLHFVAIDTSLSVDSENPVQNKAIALCFEDLEADIANLQTGKADGSEIPTKLSELDDDVGFLREEIDPTVPAWAKEPNKPIYSASEVGALPADTALFSGDYEDLENKPVIPSVEGLASEDVVVISNTEPDWNESKIWIDEGEPEEEYVTVAQFNQTIGSMENLLKEV